MTNSQERLFISENGIISLPVNEDIDIDSTSRLYVNASNNQKLELKYPNLANINSNLSVENSKYLKRIILKVKPKKKIQSTSLSQSVLGIYPNLAYDPINKINRIVIQGFVPHKILYYQDILRIGDLILSINDIEVTYENIESILSSIKEKQRLKLVALGCITYINLNTADLIISKEISDLIKPKNDTKTIFAPSKSTNVVQGDRVKTVIPSLTYDDVFFYAMILSLDPATLNRKQISKEKEQEKEKERDKNDLVYSYPNDEMKFVYKKNNNLILTQLFEAIRGLFMTLSYAVKDIDKNDQAICSKIDYQGQLFNVGFLLENYGDKGILVILAPNDQINLNYFKILTKNLNETYKFTFGNSTLLDIINVDENMEIKNSLKNQLDTFFTHFHRRLLQSSQFTQFDSVINTPNIQKHVLSYHDKLKCYNEMRSKVFDSIPFFEISSGLKIDLETVLSDLESQDCVGFNEAKNGFRRQFYVIGSCLFFQNFLLVTHFDEILTKQIYNFCDHYDLFSSGKNENSTHFRIWKEVLLNNKHQNSRHFLIIVGYKELIAAMIIESGGPIAKEIDNNKIVEPNPFYIEKVLYMLFDLDDSGIILEVYQNYSSKTSKIIYNIDQFVTSSKKREKASHKRSNTRSPIRFVEKNPAVRSSSKNDRNVSQSPSRGFKKSTENLAKDSSDENSIDEYEPNNDKIYQAKSLNRYGSISDLGRVTQKTSSITNLKNDRKIFSDLSLTNSILYYAGTETNTNGILFIPRLFDLNSALFRRFFYNYVQTCFKIKNLFNNFDKKEKNFLKNDVCHEIIEQGVLFDMFIENDKLKGKQDDKSKRKEFNFWVVGRRKLQRVDSNSEWISHGDFFVCFHDNLEDIVLELAFDIGFAKMNF